MIKKIALIFGVTGQDGAYLSELLIKKGYLVHGVKRRSSSFNTGRVDHIYQDPFEKKRNFFLHYGDVTDAISVSSLIKKIKPSEIYNLAAQSHVSVSFEVPEYTANADAIGALRILEAINFMGLKNNKILSSWNFRNVWQSNAGTSNRKNTILSKKSLWCSKSLCALDYSKL